HRRHRADPGHRAQAGRLVSTVDQAGDVAYSMGASTFEHRAVVVAEDTETLRGGLANIAQDRPGVIKGVAASQGKTALLFSGQGAQRAGMGRELEAYPVFAEAY